jgi:small basic protein (TIGR04137 family)
MTMDKSLKSSGKLARRRNVLTRDERVEKLEEAGKWDEGESVFGLPKVKVAVRAPKGHGKEKKKEEEGAEALEGVEAAGEEEE